MTYGKIIELLRHAGLHATGWISFARQCSADSRWHFSTEGGRNWVLSAHGFGLRFEVIGPFTLTRGKRTS